MSVKTILASLFSGTAEPEIRLADQKLKGENKDSNHRMRRPEFNKPASELPNLNQIEDFRSSMNWRIFRIMAELMDGWQFLTDFPNNVAVFGSSTVLSKQPWSKEAERLGTLLADAGYTVVTGGGPGIMEAANKGATLATDPHKGDSLGLNIKISHFARVNPYVNKGVAFDHFFVRNLMISYSARTYIYFPGGYGTLSHLSTVVTLIQTKKIYPPVPVVLVGRDFWKPITDWVDRIMFKKFKTIDAEDMQLYQTVDTAEEAFEIVRQSKPRTRLSI